MTTGHDARFRRLYADEAAGRLAGLTSGALALRSRDDPATVRDALEGMIRDAHTLKGGAMVVGFPQVARLAHVLEDVLSDVGEGERRATAQLVDALLHAVDGLRDLIAGAVEGPEDRAATDGLVAQVEAAAARPSMPRQD